MKHKNLEKTNLGSDNTETNPAITTIESNIHDLRNVVLKQEYSSKKKIWFVKNFEEITKSQNHKIIFAISNFIIFFSIFFINLELNKSKNLSIILVLKCIHCWLYRSNFQIWLLPYNWYITLNSWGMTCRVLNIHFYKIEWKFFFESFLVQRKKILHYWFSLQMHENLERSDEN